MPAGTWMSPKTRAVALRTRFVAVIVARPLPTSVTSPVEFTVATVRSDDENVIPALEIANPLRSRSTGVSRAVSPTAVRRTESGERIIVCTTCATPTEALPDTVPAVAVITVDPGPRARANPDELTVTTAAFPVDQVTA